MRTFDNTDVDFGYAMNRYERAGLPLVSLLKFEEQISRDLENPEVARAYEWPPENPTGPEQHTEIDLPI